MMPENAGKMFGEKIEKGALDSFAELLRGAKENPVDAVVVLSGGVKKIVSGKEIIAGSDITDGEIPINTTELPSVGTRKSRISSAAFNDPDHRNSLGWGKAKDIATAEVVVGFPQAQPDHQIIIVTSSRSTNNKSSVSDARISEDALRRCGVKNEILRQERSLDTFTELLESIRLAVEKSWKHIVFITTAYQRPRAEAMAESILHVNDTEEARKVEQVLAFNANRFNRDKLPSRVEDQHRFKDSYDYLRLHLPIVRISFVNAEDALQHRDEDHYGKVIDAARRNPLYDEKIRQDGNAAT